MVIFTDPYSKEIGLHPPRTRADIVAVSHQHYDHNNVQCLKDNPFIIDTPGEFEIKNVFIKGITSFHDKSKGKERGPNTIYTIYLENITICHLGDLGEILNGKQLDRIGDVDILMVPVGEIYTLPSKEAIKVINQIEPKIIIPMHYAVPHLNIKLSKVSKFLKEMGVSKRAISKYSFKKKDIKEEQNDTVVLTSLG